MLSKLLSKPRNKKVAVAVTLAIPLLVFGKHYFNGASCKIQKDLHGKHVVITGGNTGIGKETALELARMGAHVTIACRDSEKTKSAIEEIKLKSNNQNIDFLNFDLLDIDSVSQSIQNIHKSHSVIDILILNAGAMFKDHATTTKHNIERTFMVNHLGHFLFTLGALDLVKKSSEGRIIVVSSKLHLRGTPNFENVGLGTENYTLFKAYNQSKLFNVMFALELQNKLKALGVFNVKVVSLHPGVVRTELHRDWNYGLLFKIRRLMLSPLWYFITKNSKQGAQTSIYCSVCHFSDLVGGEYYADCALKKMNSLARDEAHRKKLWALSEEYIKLLDQNVSEHICSKVLI